ncbi:MAG: amino acid ABC transporter substrate-binding protein [Candidatus Thalassarchaeum sp.]|nr:amino acid ABC transporter substrate-binding protein [Candidatus Thalassarchaeum sp.]
MNRGTTVLIVLMMIAVPLAGCAGGDLEEQISDLEAAADVDQATIEGLESSAEADASTISALQGQVASLEDQIAANGDVTELEQYNAQLISENTQLQLDLDNSPTQEDVDTAYQQGLLAGSDTSTLDVILARGTMKCGVKESQYGMGYLDAATGVRSGLDISYCRAVAAAIGLDPDTDVEYIPASGSDRFEKLASGVIDVLIRTTTWTTSRDADLNADFAGMNFFDGQGILIREDRFSAAASGNSATALDSANICVGIGTTTEGNMQDWFASREIAFTSVPVADAAEATAKFIDGSCDAFTGDMSAMVAKKWQLDTDGSMGGVDIWIASELMSKEPLGAATRDMDSDFKDVVAWVWYGMVTAEEMGVTSSNHGAMATTACAVNDAGSAADPGMCRLLTENLGLGTATNPLAGTWMAAVLDAAGNYGEAYDDAFCAGDYDGTSGSAAMNDCLISRAGTLNALVSEGGIQYAPPMR